MRFWRAVGDASLILLYLALLVGPLAKLWPKVGKLLSYRRELGVWFGIFALVHTVLILNGWARWSVLRFFGYDFITQLDRWARVEPGFGLANLLGLVAVLISLILMATSTDWAMRTLGGGAWKFLQYSAYTVFYLVVIHTAYFLFLHYTVSFHRSVPADPNWFRFPFLAMTLLLISLQITAFFRSGLKRQKRQAINPKSPKLKASASPQK